jgi:hypothetical protein
LLQFDPTAVGFARNAVSAARDHAKIMRAGFPALDPEVYAHDESTRVHAVDNLVTTWDGLTTRHGDRTIRVAVECDYRGAITGRCLETAAIDRIMCNYVNNAMRFAADGRCRCGCSGSARRWSGGRSGTRCRPTTGAGCSGRTGATCRHCSAAAPRTAATGSG